MNQHEFEHQCALFNWAELHQPRYPVLSLLRGSMNGVRLTPTQAAKAKAAGMKKGEHDVTLPVSRGGYIGLSIEMKYGENKPTREQIDYGARLKVEGWFVAYCWDWEAAANLIKRYLAADL